MFWEGAYVWMVDKEYAVQASDVDFVAFIYIAVS